MSEEFVNAVFGGRATTKKGDSRNSGARNSGDRADTGEGSRPYMHQWYGKDGKHGSERRSSSRPTFDGMAGYVSGSGNEANYNNNSRRERQSYKSRFGSGQQQPDAGAQDEYDENQYAGAEAAAQAEDPALSVLNTTELINYDIKKAKGMRAVLGVQFSGSPAHFALGKAPVVAEVDPVGGQAGSQAEWDVQRNEVTGFNPTKCHFVGKEMAKNLRDPGKAATLDPEDKNALAISGMAKNQQMIVPLAAHVQNVHNPFPFPVGLRSSHEPFNQVVTRSGEKYMALLAPGTHNANTHIDLRSGISVRSVCASATVATDDISRQYMQSGRRAGNRVMVEQGSTLHTALDSFSKTGKIPEIDVSSLPVVKTGGGTYHDGVPEDSVHYAIEQLEKIQMSTHGKQSINHVSFSIHPLNFEGRWDGSHLSGAGYDRVTNEALYTDFMHRPVSVFANVELEYL